MEHDPAVTDPDKYVVVFENERVRVLLYTDEPGAITSPHRHPDSVMYTLSEFDRRLVRDGNEVTVHMPAGKVAWLDAQEHHGENVGHTQTRVLFVELKESRPAEFESSAPLGPSS